MAFAKLLLIPLLSSHLMLNRLGFILLFFLSISATTNAQTYIGGNFSLLTYKDSDVSNTFNVSPGSGIKADADLGLLNLTLGYSFNRWLSLETRAGAGLFSDEFLPSIELSIEKQYGIYSKLFITDELELISPYLMLGYTVSKAELEFTDPSVSFSKTEEDISFGVGLDIELQQDFSVGLEFAQLIKTSTFEVLSINIGVTKKF